MIDTIKIYASISKDIYDKIHSKSIVKNALNCETGELLYNIINDQLEGSYSSHISVRPSCSSKYRLNETDYVCEIEGSYHKFILGYNSHNGFYDLQYICSELIKYTNMKYNIELPSLENWYLQRCDIAICFDLQNQNNVCNYINNLSSCNYSRRKVKFYSNEALYLSGTTTTLKIYNKLLEFKKHDLKKFVNTDFDIIKHMKDINGFIRFECEIKKKMLIKVYDENHIKVINVGYEDLKKVWSDEFMKLLKFIKNDLEIVKNRNEVYNRLKKYYSNSKAINLYNFYLMCCTDGVDNVKKRVCKSVYYDRIKSLKQLNIDLSQKYDLVEYDSNIVDFNPFTYKEVV